MTEPAPTFPFRRFPWAALVFCLACLTMTGWTWMRYSYCWRMTSTEALQHIQNIGERAWPTDAYVELDYRKLDIRAEVPAWPSVGFSLAGFSPEPEDRVCRGRWSPITEGFFAEDGEGSEFLETIITLEAASRFHPGSIAGLVVGAMGCLIFGLYLRRWLRERKALASEPQQDMIA